MLIVLATCALLAPPTNVQVQERPSAPQTGVILAGEVLQVELGCARCHGELAGEMAASRVVRAPSLENAGARRSPEYVRRYLSDPLHVRPGTRMPDMLAGLDEAQREEAVEDLVHFLQTRGGPFDREATGVTLELLDEGRQLYHEVGCVACHGAEESVDALFEPLDLARKMNVDDGDDDLSSLQLLDLAEKTSVDALTAFLLDPEQIRRSGRMPSLSLNDSEARAIASYLLREQTGDVLELIPTVGMRYRYYEERVQGGAPDVAAWTPTREGVLLDELGLLEHREDNFVYTFHGQLTLEEAGSYRFQTYSDDGSQLFIDGELVVDNGGNHAPQRVESEVELDAGVHRIEVTYFENSGGEELAVSWSGPSFDMRPMRGDEAAHLAYSLTPPGAPFEVDLQRAKRGEQAFERFGCVTCHDEVEAQSIALGAFDPEQPTGCLAVEPIEGVPHFDLSDAQLEQLSIELTPGFEPAPRESSPEQDVERVFRNARCYACHARGEFTGPSAARRGYFFSNGEVDLGEEGRVPPHLHGVGAKLTSDALHDVLFDASSVRPYLVTRMPQFAAEVLDDFVTAVRAADMASDASAPPVFDSQLSRAGQHLAGTKGFGCIQCHTFAGYDSLGIPAVDLAFVADRIQYPWFRELLRDPAAINMNTRMPGFWIDGESPVKDVLGGDKDAQIDALWTYLSLGGSMPLPHGLVTPDSAYELTPEDDPLLVGVFMEDVSPRTIAVGLPEGIHYAFDVENSRLALVWRGRFFNARGTWRGRAGALESPASKDATSLPAGPPFALLAEEGSPWPRTEERAPKLRALGRGFDEARRPVFRYALGEIVIEEHLVPTQRDGRAALAREFKLSSPTPVEQLTFRAADGERVRINFEPAASGSGYSAEYTTEITW